MRLLPDNSQQKQASLDPNFSSGESPRQLNDVIIECRHIYRQFDVGDQPFHALRDVSLQIRQGELIAIVGASGSGKSTLLNVIGCLDEPTSGELFVRGVTVKNASDAELATLRNQTFGFVFQQFNLLPRYSALRNVTVPLVYANVPRSERTSRAIALLNLLDIGEQAHKRPSQMSGGQQQRIAIARALANDPLVLLADEPTGALDSKTSADVIDLLIKLNQERHITVIIVTHDANVAAKCRRVIRFADGAVVEDKFTHDTTIAKAA
jgi:putative ABC transport system ATP-binding protein